jgi:alpha-galactosidase
LAARYIKIDDIFFEISTHNRRFQRLVMPNQLFGVFSKFRGRSVEVLPKYARKVIMMMDAERLRDSHNMLIKDGVDLYPEIKRRAAEKQKQHHNDMVRYELMFKFGYYVTESSEHNAEYYPYFIKRNYPELIEQLNIPLDEYPRRCVEQIESWKKMREKIVGSKHIYHGRSHEYASFIFEAIESLKLYTFHGNVMNTGLITNLPKEACVEVTCVADRNGVVPTYVGDLPPQCAALNRTNINAQLLTLEAAITRKKEHIYHAAMLDPHTSTELSMDEIISLCDDLIEAHGNWLPLYQ